MKVFISYSTAQLEIARKIKAFLDEVGLDSFLAADDLRIASDWKDRIINELNECDIIVPVLSKEFKASDWCPQELGIFYFLKKKIIPISADEIIPFGFFSHIQPRAIRSKFLNDLSLELFVSEGLMECASIADAFICLLKKEKEMNYRMAEEIFRKMAPYFDKLKKEEVNSIIEVSIKNGQIWSAAECADKYLPKLLELRKDDIDAVLREKIENKITNGNTTASPMTP
jgi:hypothetical protein